MKKKQLLLEKLTDSLELCIQLYEGDANIYILEAGNSIDKAIYLVEKDLAINQDG